MSETLENLLRENRRFPPPPAVAAQANVTAEAYEQAAADRLAFWSAQARRLSWAPCWKDLSFGPASSMTVRGPAQAPPDGIIT